MKNFIDGWGNFLFENEEAEKISKERMKICNGCEHKKEMIGIDVCGLCLCPLVAKTRALEEKCPIGKW